MSKIYLIRHAETYYNQAQRISESLGEPHENAEFRWNPDLVDACLTDEGISQCEQAKPFIHSLPITKVFVSPLRRALQTAKILFTGHPLSPVIIVSTEIHEILNNGHDISVFSGSPLDGFQDFDWGRVHTHFKSAWLADESVRAECGNGSIQEILDVMKKYRNAYLEPVRSVWERAQRGKEIWKKEQGKIALVTHSTFLREFTKKRFEDDGLWLKNCECIEYELE